MTPGFAGRSSSCGYWLLISTAKQPAIDDEQTGKDQRHSEEFEWLQPFAEKDRAKHDRTGRHHSVTSDALIAPAEAMMLK